jgi:hypothetical protein
VNEKWESQWTVCFYKDQCELNTNKTGKTERIINREQLLQV